ncbi:MAG: TolC family protein [Planctomycetales bacterium]|nr:TolC family protein [Planctomycetales bacterium]
MDWTCKPNQRPLSGSSRVHAGGTPGITFAICAVLLMIQSGTLACGQDIVPRRVLSTSGLIETTVTDVSSESGAVFESLESCDPLESLPIIRPRGTCDSYLDTYRVRIADRVDTQNELDGGISATQYDSAQSIRMWWDDLINQPLGFSNQRLVVDVGSLTTSALAHSPRIRALLAEPHILQSSVTVADAAFDPMLFLEGKFVDTNDPVGNQLTTGDQSRRFRDETLSAKAGLRRRTRNGGEVELVQRGGFQENNSIFLQPNPQGTTRLELNYTQPLWKNAGTAVNRSQIVVAQLKAYQASSEARFELENHLLEVTSAYWELYRNRALWLQQQKLVGSTRQLHDLLNSRGGFDAGRRHILRARAALASRQAGLTRSAAKIKDVQSRLRMLVGSEQLIAASGAEWMTSEAPLAAPVAVSAKGSLIQALENRSDITTAIQEIHEVSVRVGVAKNQVLPQLDLLLGTYVAGLDAGRDPLGAFENQFTQGRPGYSVGLAYEIPVGNRAAQSRLNRNRWELSQVIEQFRQTTESAIAEVEIATRETKTAFQDLVEKRIAIDAAESEVAYLTQRYQELPGRDDSLILLIDNLLDAQDRLAEQESDFVNAQVAYAMSWVSLRRATGTLLRFDDEATVQ